MEKITIKTGSHTSVDQINKEAFDKLNSLLLSDENPLENYFQQEDLMLDSTDRHISIVPSSIHSDYPSEKELSEFLSFLNSHVDAEPDLLVFIGSQTFNLKREKPFTKGLKESNILTNFKDFLKSPR